MYVVVRSSSKSIARRARRACSGIVGLARRVLRGRRCSDQGSIGKPQNTRRRRDLSPPYLSQRVFVHTYRVVDLVLTKLSFHLRRTWSCSGVCSCIVDISMYKIVGFAARTFSISAGLEFGAMSDCDGSRTVAGRAAWGG